jgi:hypothetical protein
MVLTGKRDTFTLTPDQAQASPDDMKKLRAVSATARVTRRRWSQ